MIVIMHIIGAIQMQNINNIVKGEIDDSLKVKLLVFLEIMDN